MLGEASVQLHHAALHQKHTGWAEEELDGWNFSVLQALMHSPCARKRWHALSGEAHGAVAPSRDHVRRITLERRRFFQARCAAAIVDVDGSHWQCAYCRKTYKNYYSYISVCAPECSKFDPPFTI